MCAGVHYVFVEMTLPDGQLFFVRYLTPYAGTERDAANEALARFSDMEPGYTVRSAHVFREPPATFYPRSQPRLVAK